MTDRSLATECPICLEVTFDELTGKCPHGPVADLPCRHLVHVSCLEEQARILHGHGRDRGRDRGDRVVGRRDGGDVLGTWTVRREEDRDHRPNGGEDDDGGREGGVGRMVQDLEEGRADDEAADDDDDSSSSPPGLLPRDDSDDEEEEYEAEYEADNVVYLTGAGAPQPQRLALPRRTLTGSGLFVRRRRPQYHWGQRVPSRPRLVDQMTMASADGNNDDDEEDRSSDDGHGHILYLTSDPGGGIDEEDATDAGIDGEEEEDDGDMPELMSDHGGEDATAGTEEEGQPGADDGSSSSSGGYSSMPELISDPSSSSSDEDTTEDEEEDSDSSSEDDAAGDLEGGSRSGGSSSSGYTDMPELISYPGSSGSSSDSDYLDTTTDDEEDDIGRRPSVPLVLGGYVLRGSLSAGGSPPPEDEDGDEGAGEDQEDDDGMNGGEDDHDLDDMPSLMSRNSSGDEDDDDESDGEDDQDLDDMPSLTSRNISDDEDDDDSSSDDDDDDGPIPTPVGTEIATMSRELEEMIRMREEYIFHIRDLIRLDHDHHHNFEFRVGGGRSRSRFGGSLGPGETCCPTCRHPVNLADVVARDHVAHLSAYWVGRIEFAVKVLGVGNGFGGRRRNGSRRRGRGRRRRGDERGVPLDRLVRFLRAADTNLPQAIRDEYLDMDRLTATAAQWGFGNGEDGDDTALTVPSPFETALFHHRGGVSYGIAETSDRTAGGRSKGIWAVMPGQRHGRRRRVPAREGPPLFWLYEWDPVPPGSTCRSCGRREGTSRVALTAGDDEASSAHRHSRAVTGVAGTTHVSLGACSGCLESRHVAYYCGVECQRRDRSRHGRECRRFRSLRAGGLRPDLR